MTAPSARIRCAVDPLRTVGCVWSPRPGLGVDPGACHKLVGSERSGGRNGSGSCISRFSRDG